MIKQVRFIVLVTQEVILEFFETLISITPTKYSMKNLHLALKNIDPIERITLDSDLFCQI